MESKNTKVKKVKLKKLENVEVLIGKHLQKEFTHRDLAYFLSKDIFYNFCQNIKAPIICLWNKKEIIDNQIVSREESVVIIHVPKICSDIEDTALINEFALDSIRQHDKYKVIFVALKDDYNKDLFDKLNIHLYLHFNIQFISIESYSDLCNVIFRMSKSISESHAKIKYYNSKFTFHPEGENIKTIKLPSEANEDLHYEKWKKEVWKAQICSFNNVTNDIAEAIVSSIPSLNHLIQSYDDIIKNHFDSNLAIQQCQLLLKDISINRGAGILQTSRKVGPELSKKIYTFFTHNDPQFQF